ncbi:MAG: YbhB/YbcL family Raf kinase inhibitor-like protein [Cardiobacterium sp.]|nr:MAG: YbhB/YbcL family Raf kinase inhibitor-like protein [Cardiobacterium sp.]
MKKCLVAALIAASLAAHADTLEVKQPAKPAQTLQLSSPDIQDGATLTLAQVADSFGCSGKNLSPALQWTGVPKEAKSLVLTVYDPDAPTGSGFWHWAVYNLPASATGLPAGAGATDAKLPDGAAVLKNDGGIRGFIGACPPPGDTPHRYIYTLYALDSRLDLPADATPAVLGFSLNGKVLASGQLTALYGQ